MLTGLLLLPPKEATEAYEVGIELLRKARKQAKEKAKEEAKGKEKDEDSPRIPSLRSSTPRKLPLEVPVCLSVYQKEQLSVHLVCYYEGKTPQVFAYDIKRSLGEPGAQGTVYLAQQLFSMIKFNGDNENIVVAKCATTRFNLKDYTNEKDILIFLERFRGMAVKESLIFLFMKHEHGVNLLDLLYSKEPGQSDKYKQVYGFIYQKRTLMMREKLKYAQLLFNALNDLHEHKAIYHRDFKNANIMVAHDCSKATLIDFGTSCRFLKTDRTFRGSSGYQAFEGVLPFKPTKPGDQTRPAFGLQQEYFSLAISLLEIFSDFNYQEFLREKTANVIPPEKYALTIEDVRFAFQDMLNRVASLHPTPEEALLIDLIEFCKECINVDPNTRPLYAIFNSKRGRLNRHFAEETPDFRILDQASTERLLEGERHSLSSSQPSTPRTPHSQRNLSLSTHGSASSSSPREEPMPPRSRSTSLAPPISGGVPVLPVAFSISRGSPRSGPTTPVGSPTSPPHYFSQYIATSTPRPDSPTSAARGRFNSVGSQRSSPMTQDPDSSSSSEEPFDKKKEEQAKKSKGWK